MKYFQKKNYCQSKIIWEKWIFQLDEDNNTWDEVCEELAIETDDSSTGEVSTNEDSSDDIEADSGEAVCVTSKEGSVAGEMYEPSTSTYGRSGRVTKCEEKKMEGSTSSSSDSDVKVMRKRKCILIESDSSSDEKFEDQNNETEETCKKLMEKNRRALLSKAFHYTSVQNVRTPVKVKGKLIPTWHNAMVCKTLNVLFAISRHPTRLL